MTEAQLTQLDMLPKITYSIESRKSRVINDLDQTEKLKKDAEQKLQEYKDIIEKETINNKNTFPTLSIPNTVITNGAQASGGTGL